MGPKSANARIVLLPSLAYPKAQPGSAHLKFGAPQDHLRQGVGGRHWATIPGTPTTSRSGGLVRIKLVFRQ